MEVVFLSKVKEGNSRVNHGNCAHPPLASSLPTHGVLSVQATRFQTFTTFVCYLYTQFLREEKEEEGTWSDDPNDEINFDALFTKEVIRESHEPEGKEHNKETTTKNTHKTKK